MTGRTLPLVTLFLLFASILTLPMAQAPEPLDGPKRPLYDDLLDRMAGAWRLTGLVAGGNANHDVRAEWILNHQFLQVHEKAVDSSGGNPPYEAFFIIGYDNASERYVTHLVDIYGGRFSETLGFGKRAGNSLELVFEYPDGPFRTVFEWRPEKSEWHWRMTQKNQAGKWTEFGNMTLVRAAAK
ncbi:MAG TPA: DUF1579 family protein [Terriglobales bacterium]|nr:DUF1579 family protein [Terriglobales bacterium]